MNSYVITAIAFGAMFGGAAFGALLRDRLPSHHLQAESRDMVQLGAGFIATLAALVLGLMVTSAKDAFDAVNGGVTEGAGSCVNLDRILAQYGLETNVARDQLRLSVVAEIERTWPAGPVDPNRGRMATSPELETLASTLRQLSPRDDSQRILKDVALDVFSHIMTLRWQVQLRANPAIPATFLVMLIFWFAVMFALFTLLSPRNLTVTVVLLLCALSGAGGIMIIQDMSRPFQGVVRVSSAPLDDALRQLGR
ncbi:MAG: hypothetical protein ACRDUX_11885 [Mycobacterium sp.]